MALSATIATATAGKLDKSQGVTRKLAAAYEKAPSVSQGVSVFNVTTTTGCIRQTERSSAGLFVTNPADSGQTIQIGFGQIDTLNAPEAFGGTYSNVAAGTTWTFYGPDPVWVKVASGTADIIIDQEVYA